MSLLGGTIRAGVSLVLISALAFAVIGAMPSDPVEVAMRAWNLPPDAAAMQALRVSWGLDRPVWQRWLHWAAGFVQGDWGRSFRTGEPIAREFLRRLPLSFALGVSGLALALAAAVPLGFLAALRPGRLADRFSRLLAVAGQAVPGFWLGLLALWLLGVQWRLMRPFSGDLASHLLPLLLIALPVTGELARIYRCDMLAVSRQPYFVTALSKGRGRAGALWHHAGRSALYAALAGLRGRAGWAIGATATLEVLLSLPGISQFLVQSIAARDYQVLQAYVMVVALWMIVMNLGLGAVMRGLDPRT